VRLELSLPLSLDCDKLLTHVPPPRAACPPLPRPTTHPNAISSSRTRRRRSSAATRSSRRAEGTPSSRRLAPARSASSSGARPSHFWLGVRPFPLLPVGLDPKIMLTSLARAQLARSTPSGPTTTCRSTTSSASRPSGGCATRTRRRSGPTPTCRRRASRRCTTTRSTASTSRSGSRRSQRRSARRPRRGPAGTPTCSGTATTTRCVCSLSPLLLKRSLKGLRADDSPLLALAPLAGRPLCRRRAPQGVRQGHAGLLRCDLSTCVARRAVQPRASGPCERGSAERGE